MSNKSRGEVSIDLAGKKHILRPSFQAICAIEGELNKSILDILIGISEKKLRLSDMVSVVKHGMHAYQENSTILGKNIGSDIYEAGLVNIMPTIILFLEMAVGIQNKEE
jgi:hypothetical protein